MLTYFFINIIIVLHVILVKSLIKRDNNLIYEVTKKKMGNQTKFIVWLPIFLILWFVSGFRGDFTSDYINYSDLFDYYKLLGLEGLFSGRITQEWGYVSLNLFLGTVYDHSLIVFIITSFIILLNLFKVFKLYSEYFWISVFLFVTVGLFYESFNIIRQVLAASIIFLGTKYLINRSFKKYFVVVIVSALFHKTALIMIPFYFILNFKWNLKNLVSIFVLFIGGFLSIDTLLPYLQRLLYQGYSLNSYGMTGFAIGNVFIPLMLFIFVIIHLKVLDKKDTLTRLLLNSTLYYFLFSIMGLKIMLLERFSVFFEVYVYILIPLILYKLSNKYLRLFYVYALIILCISYNYYSLMGSGYDPYYLIFTK